MLMTPKEKCDALQFLARIHRSQFDERRKHEWKVVFTILTFFVLVAAAGVKGEFQKPLLAGYVFYSLAAISSLFLAFVHHANHLNKIIAQAAESGIQDILNGRSPTLNILPPKVGVFSWLCRSGWAWIWQTAVVFIFAHAVAGVTGS